MRKRNSHWERLGLPLSLRLGKWNFYNNLVLSNAGDPYITENITHNSHQNIHIVNQNIDRENIRRINETFSMLYDITTLQSIGLNCMVKQAGSTHDELRILGAVVADSGSHILPPHDVFSIVFNSQTLVKLKMCMVY